LSCDGDQVALREHNRRMKMPMQKGLHIASINTAKVHVCIVCVQNISNAAVVLCQPTRVQVAMLSKNCNPRAQVPNGDADYDDGGD
jgi:hypothetical protein